MVKPWDTLSADEKRLFARMATPLRRGPVRRPRSEAVSRQYSNGFPFTGGNQRRVAINVGKEAYADLELKAQAMMARE